MAHQDFLSSMTFASSAGCECDECGIPEEILEAVRKRKAEQTHSYGNKRVHIEQTRELVARYGGYSIWRLTLPVGSGDPIVELRNSYRVLFVERLACQTQIKSIGRGIIGSAAEEKDRKIMNWEKSRAYFLPVAKGIGCGWICTQSDNKDVVKQNDDEYSPIDAMVYILKVTTDALSEELDSAPSWVERAKKLFISLSDYSDTTTDECQNDETEKIANSNGMEGIHLQSGQSVEVRQIIEDAMCGSGSLKKAAEDRSG